MKQFIKEAGETGRTSGSVFLLCLFVPYAIRRFW